MQQELSYLVTNCNRACLTSFHANKAKTTSTKLVIFLLAYFNSNILYSVHYVCLKGKTFCICFFSPSSSSPGLFQKIEEFGAKKKFTDHQTATTIQIFVAIKGNFSGLIFFWTSCREGKFPQDYLINEANCLFTYHWEKTFSTGQNPVWSVMAVPEHGTIIWNGITCKKISFYLRDLACMWFIVENAKIFWSYVKHFLNFLLLRKLYNIDWFI